MQLDDGYDAARAATNARTLLANDKADLLFGFVGTASSEAGAAAAAQQGSLLFAPFAASDSLRGAAHPNVFHVRPSMADEAIKIVRHCATVGQTRIALVGDEDAMGRAGLAAVQQAHDRPEARRARGERTCARCRRQARCGARRACRSSSRRPSCWCPCSSTTANVIRKLRKSGYAGAFMAFSIVGIDPLLRGVGQGHRRHRDLAGRALAAPSAIPIVKEYLAAIDNSDQTASYEGIEGFIAAKAAGEAVRRAGRGFTSASLQRVMAGMTDYDVGGFRINLRPGLRDPQRSIDLISITADGRVLR